MCACCHAVQGNGQVINVGRFCATNGPCLLSNAGVLQHQDTQEKAQWRIRTEADTLDLLPASPVTARPSDDADDLEVGRDLRTSAPTCASPSGVA